MRPESSSREQFDMVVLSVGVETTPETVELAKRLGIDVTDHNFASNRRVCAGKLLPSGNVRLRSFPGPQRHSQSSVMEASAAACAAAIDLAPARGSQVKVKEIPVEKDVSEEAPQDRRLCLQLRHKHRFGGGRKGSYKVRRNSTECGLHHRLSLHLLPGQPGEGEGDHKGKQANRVVVAACSPRTHEPLFQETLKDCGLNKYLFEMANIRDQDSWVHQQGTGACNRKGQRPRSHVGGPRFSSQTADREVSYCQSTRPRRRAAA